MRKLKFHEIRGRKGGFLGVFVYEKPLFNFVRYEKF